MVCASTDPTEQEQLAFGTFNGVLSHPVCTCLELRRLAFPPCLPPHCACLSVCPSFNMYFQRTESDAPSRSSSSFSLIRGRRSFPAFFPSFLPLVELETSKSWNSKVARPLLRNSACFCVRPCLLPGRWEESRADRQMSNPTG